jgi:hypothetical protein
MEMGEMGERDTGTGAVVNGDRKVRERGRCAFEHFLTYAISNSTQEP